MKKASKPPSRSSLDESLVLERNEAVLWRPLEDGTVSILHVDDQEHVFSLDGVAANFWTLLDGQKKISQLRDQLLRKFRFPADRFDRELTKLLGDLIGRKLVSVVSAKKS